MIWLAIFGESWWQEVTLLLLALDNPCLFEQFMRILIQKPSFTQYPELVEMCLDDAAEKPLRPFLELLQAKPGNDRNFWQRQLAAFKLVERFDNSALNGLVQQLARHPFNKICERIVQRTDRAKRKIVTSSRGGYELVWIPGGKFSMGSPDNEEGRYKSEGPVRLVNLPAFFMGRYPVTNEEYGRFLVENPEAREPKYWSERRYNKSSQPVVGVRWIEAKQYARWAGLQLPSEAQWEYACRAGTQTRFCSGELETDLKRVGWYERNSDAPHPVGQKEPNGFGLYDMHGNIWEWVEDDWHKKYSGAPIDGSAWIYKNSRGLKEDIDVLENNTHLPVVVRGGSVFRSERACRSASRRAEEISYRDNSIGFRLVLPPGQQR